MFGCSVPPTAPAAAELSSPVAPAPGGPNPTQKCPESTGSPWPAMVWSRGRSRPLVPPDTRVGPAPCLAHTARVRQDCPAFREHQSEPSHRAETCSLTRVSPACRGAWGLPACAQEGRLLGPPHCSLPGRSPVSRRVQLGLCTQTPSTPQGSSTTPSLTCSTPTGLPPPPRFRLERRVLSRSWPLCLGLSRSHWGLLVCQVAPSAPSPRPTSTSLEMCIFPRGPAGPRATCFSTAVRWVWRVCRAGSWAQERSATLNKSPGRRGFVPMGTAPNLVHPMALSFQPQREALFPPVLSTPCGRGWLACLAQPLFCHVLWGKAVLPTPEAGASGPVPAPRLPAQPGAQAMETSRLQLNWVVLRVADGTHECPLHSGPRLPDQEETVSSFLITAPF